MQEGRKGKIQLNIDLSPLRVRSVKLWSYIPSCFWTSEPLGLPVLDFFKAFDTVQHRKFLKKLEQYGIKGQVYDWIAAWLTRRSQRVTLDGECSAPAKVSSGVPQGTILGPLMFLIYIIDIGDGIYSNLRLFAHDSLLYLVIDTPNDAAQLQNDKTTWDKLSQWAAKWQTVV